MLENVVGLADRKSSHSAGRGDAEMANRWRRLATFIRSVVAELAMWDRLADEDASGAWNHYCDAERLAHLYERWLPTDRFANDRIRHVREVERAAFPRQPRFLSMSYIASEVACTICLASYGSCSHLSGEIYDGKIAGREVIKTKGLREISFVDRPRNKRCRVTSVGGIDPLTGEPSTKTLPSRKVNGAL
jgi:hypothetical protein